MLEEAYLYIDMPAPSWGVQFVYTDPRNPELVVVVREAMWWPCRRAITPTFCAGRTVGSCGLMAGHRKSRTGSFGVVNVQPEYAQGGSGLEASRK